MKRLCVTALLAASALGAQEKLDINAMSAPRVLSKPEPVYTVEAREAKVHGRVLARIVIGTDGTVTQAEIVEPLGFGLDLAALEVLAQWKFEPARRLRNNEPVSVFANVEINFRLL